MTLGISLVSQRTKQPARKAFLPQSLSFKSRLYIGFVASKTLTSLRQVWVLFQRTCEFNGIQFIKHFSEFVFVETNEVDRSNSNVILTRQTCGHRSSRVAESKRQALALYFSGARGKRKGFSLVAAARHSQYARNFPKKFCFVIFPS